MTITENRIIKCKRRREKYTSKGQATYSISKKDLGQKCKKYC
jgi:hypothetical protein